VWKLHTGRPWRDVPGRFGPWQTCYSRLRRWQTDGTWPRVWALLAADQAGSGHDRLGQATLPAALRWDRDSDRWFAFALLACAVVCFNRLDEPAVETTSSWRTGQVSSA
jgi:Putative transposase of IS4/5 family (DUF4096)